MTTRSSEIIIYLTTVKWVERLMLFKQSNMALKKIIIALSIQVGISNGIERLISGHPKLGKAGFIDVGIHRLTLLQTTPPPKKKSMSLFIHFCFVHDFTADVTRAGPPTAVAQCY
jgi:hypothetical protein